jgi:hypothetical protein
VKIDLGALVAQALGGTVEAAVLSQLRGILDAPLDERAASHVGRDLSKPLDKLLQDGPRELSVNQRADVAQALAEAAAAQLMEAAAALRDYPRWQVAVVKAKAAGEDVAAARAGREAAQGRIRNAVAGALAAVAGKG